MSQLQDTSQDTLPDDGSQFMRPFAIGATAFLFGQNLLYIFSRSKIQSPDAWSELYLLILGAYAGASEVKRWVSRETVDSDGDRPEDRWRKGGPFVTAWCLLLLCVGLWRMIDPTRPMPPELQGITYKVVALFFGTYALRQVRHGVQARRSGSGSGGLREALLEILRTRGVASTAALADSLRAQKRTVQRLLRELLVEGVIVREGKSPADPNAVYRVKS